ncbi:MAG: hypothetical protein ABJA34_14345, partial [Pseudonocardiales bacterium]
MSESGDRPEGDGHVDPTGGAFEPARDPWARPPDPPPTPQQAGSAAESPADPAAAADTEPTQPPGAPAEEPPDEHEAEPPTYVLPTYPDPAQSSGGYAAPAPSHEQPPAYGGQPGYGQQG